MHMPPLTRLFLLILGSLGMFALVRMLIRGRDAIAISLGLRRLSPRNHDFARISSRDRVAPGTSRVDDRTWEDLDMDQVFVAVDRTASRIGQQQLYHQLRTPRLDPSELVPFEQLISDLARRPDVQAILAKELGRLSDPRANYLVDIAFGDLPRPIAAKWVFPFLTLAGVGCIVGFFFWPGAVILLAAVLFTNVCVQVILRPRMEVLLPALHAMPALAGIAARLGALDEPSVAAETALLRKAAGKLRTLRVATTWMLFEPFQANEYVAMVYGYINMLLCLDANAFAFSIEMVCAHQDTIRAVYETLGRLDVALSTARWRAELGVWCRPGLFASNRSIVARDLRHPLLSNPVSNDLTLREGSMLLTGSNMSGKTTFVRTLGVAAILGQTLNTVCAASYAAPPFAVRASIGRADSLMDGKSYYLAEVTTIKEMITAKSSGARHLFLIDEVFRGTNTIERVAAAHAVLQYLDQGDDMVIVATHDIELVTLLGDRFHSHHFREDIVDDSLHFDYRLKAGPSSTRNAIALLRVMQYPDAIVDAALASAVRLERVAMSRVAPIDGVTR
jgi:hypothetical protein